MRQANDARRCRAFAADAAIGDPVLGRDDALRAEQRFALVADAMHVFDIEMIGEENIFIETVQPVRALRLPSRARVLRGAPW